MPSPNYPDDGVPKLKGIPFLGAALAGQNFIGARPHFGFTTGNVYFVDSGHPNRSNEVGQGHHGRSPDSPFSTIDYAVGQCTASNGDIIYVMPGHVETVTAAAGLDLDVAGITLIGIGRGASRPTINFTTATTADMDVDAADITMVNFLFTGGFDALVAPVDVNAADFAMIDCEYRDVTGQCTDFLLTDNAADRLMINGFTYEGAAAAGTNAGFAIVGSDDCTICNLVMDGNFAVGGIDIRTTAATDLHVYNVRFRTRNAADIFLIDTITASTGMIGPNIHIRLQDNAANITEAITGATFVLFGGGAAGPSGGGINVVNAAGEVAIPINTTQSIDL